MTVKRTVLLSSLVVALLAGVVGVCAAAEDPGSAQAPDAYTWFVDSEGQKWLVGPDGQILSIAPDGWEVGAVAPDGWEVGAVAPDGWEVGAVAPDGNEWTSDR